MTLKLSDKDLNFAEENGVSIDLKKLCEQSHGILRYGTCTILTQSDGGTPLSTSIEFDNENPRIVARWREPPKVTVIGKDKGESEERLERALAQDPVMSIRKNTYDADYNVDFFAGAQRGSFEATKDQLIKGKNQAMKRPYLKAIGLDTDAPIIKAWLRQ